jgi:hypothetical protein
MQFTPSLYWGVHAQAFSVGQTAPQRPWLKAQRNSLVSTQRILRLSISTCKASVRGLGFA